MDKDGTYISPSAIDLFECSEFTEAWGEHKTYYYITIRTKGNASLIYRVSFNMTDGGFEMKKTIEDVIDKLTRCIKYPVTCGFVIKLTRPKGAYDYEMSFI